MEKKAYFAPQVLSVQDVKFETAISSGDKIECRFERRNGRIELICTINGRPL